MAQKQQGTGADQSGLDHTEQHRKDARRDEQNQSQQSGDAGRQQSGGSTNGIPSERSGGGIGQMGNLDEDGRKR